MFLVSGKEGKGEQDLRANKEAKAAIPKWVRETAPNEDLGDMPRDAARNIDKPQNKFLLMLRKMRVCWKWNSDGSRKLTVWDKIWRR